MKTQTQKWVYGLASAAIGGGSSAVTSGLTSMGFAPDKFNLTNAAGVWHLLGLMLANFVVSGVLSAFFFLRQSPLPPESVIETVESSSVTSDSTGVVTASAVKTTTTTPTEQKP